MKLAVAMILAAIILGASIFLGSDRYYRMTYDPPSEVLPTPPKLTLPPVAPVAPNRYYECVTLKALVESDINCEVYLND